ncbi:hypothetical protein B0H13DRAFT_2363761 [Mycena leptocephala]|nr:hypothetical protein B0H13DRAFT_2363761 [Mycena leptocephala]
MVDHGLVLVAYESERQGHPRVFNCPIALCFFVSTLQRLSFHFHLLDNQNIIPILYTSFVSFQDLITRLLNFASIMDPAGADAIANAFNTLQSLVQQYQPGSIAGPPQSASQGAVDSASIRPAPVTSYISTRPPRPLAYMPSAARGHPNAATTGSLPSSYQPFLGTSSLAVSMAGNSNQLRQSGGTRSRSRDRPSRSEISEANSSRNHAIEAHFPPSATVPIRRRRRGRAQPTPSLPYADTSAPSVFEIDPDTNKEHVHIRVHVYLPTSQSNTSLYLPFNLADSFDTFLDDNSLRFTYRLPTDTKILSLMSTVANDMSSSPQKWEFQQPSSSLRRHLRTHETVHLQLLGLSNRGIPRTRDGLVILTRQPIDHELTLSSLFAKENIPTFTKPRLLIRKGRLLINFIVARPGIICKTIRESSYRRSERSRAGVSRWVAPVCESDGETDDEMEVEDSLFGSDVENLPPTPTPVVRPTNRNAVALAAGSSTLSTVPIQQTNNEPSQTTSSTVSSSLSVESHNTTAPRADNVSPPTAETIDLTNDAAVEDTPTVTQLWANNWVAQPAQYGALFESSYFAKSLFETASSASNPPELVVQGQDMAELASNLIAQIRAAAANKNFTPVMSSSRTFKMRPDGSLLSAGNGLEREAIYTAFRTFADHPSIWFLPRFDNRCSIATTMSLSTSHFVSNDRRESLTVLGCLAALMLIHGIAPEPLSPAFIQFAAHQCDIQSLTRDFVGEWHAELRALIDDWNAMGPEGNLTPFQAHFATYHDIPIASLQNRDLSQHRALATDMLYTALIGPHPPSHSELKAFLTGFQIPCSNGFDFRKVICSSPGGSSMLISRTWTSIIHDFASLQPHLEVFSVHRSNLRSIAGSAHPVADMDLCDMLYSFLRGSGAPCPNLFAEAIPNLSPLIPFDQVGTVSFRSRALCWATAGCPNVEFDENQQLSVYFVGPNETGYHDEPDTRAAYMRAGLISFRTCFRTARIPISHLVELHNRSYPTLDTAGNPTEPFTVEQAVDNWLLLQILAGIGRHSFL